MNIIAAHHFSMHKCVSFVQISFTFCCLHFLIWISGFGFLFVLVGYQHHWAAFTANLAVRQDTRRQSCYVFVLLA